MNLQDFQDFNDGFLDIYSPLLKLVFILGTATFLSSIGYLAKRDARFHKASIYLHYLFTILLTVLFVFLLRYHLTLSSIEYANPLQGGSFKIFLPLWIEKERLLFWLWMYSLMVLYAQRYRIKSFTSALHLGSFGLLTAIYFAGSFTPLPEMGSLIQEYLSWEAQPYFDQRALALFRSLIGKHFLYSTWYMWVHPPMLFISYAAFTVNFFSCIFLYIKRDFTYDRIGYSFAKLGYLLLTVGLLIGYPWALEAWEGQSWWWSPIISSSFLLWFFYSGYLHSRLYLKEKHMLKVTVALGILGYLSVISAYLIIFLLPGAHAYV